jgi:olfactory receptor
VSPIMSFDHFVASHHPLRYSSIFTSSRVVHIGLVFAIKSVLLVLPILFTLKRLKTVINFC